MNSLHSPVVRATIQAAGLSAISAFLAQAITAHKQEATLQVELTPMLHFVLFNVLSTPPNFFWQRFLEESFPGDCLVPVRKGNGAEEKTVTERRLDWPNTLKKLLLDQTVGTTVNTILFIAGLGSIKGMNLEQIVGAIGQDFWPMIRAGLKLWPMVSVISFTVVPVEQRLVFGSLVGVGWGVFLSLAVAG